MALVLVSLVTACIVLIVVIWQRAFKRRNDDIARHEFAPAVPGAWLWLGNAFCIDRERPHITLTEWHAIMGPIYRFHLFGEDVVVLNSLSAVRDALLSKDPLVAGRPSIFRVRYGFHYVDDIIFGTDSARWRLLKRTAGFLLRSTSESNLGQVEGQMAAEMRHLAERFEEQKSTNFDPSLILQTTVINAVSLSLHGRRYDHTDTTMLDYKRATRLFSEACSPVNGAEIDLFPWLRFLPHKPLRKLDEARFLLDSIVDKELRRVKADFNPQQDEATCFLHGLLKMRSDVAPADSDGTSLTLTDDDIRALFIDILVSGTLTTWIALKGFVLLMVHHDDIQTRLSQLIDTVIGRDRLPTVGDRDNLDLMEASIFEVLRYMSHVPLCLPHFTTENTSIGEFSVPRDTKVLINLWSIHHDPTIWKDPWMFQPDRFLDANGKLLSSDHPLRQSLIPFGLGRRTCLGQTYAMQRLFLLATSIVQRFKLCPPEGESMPSCDPRHFELGLILEPRPFKIVALPRSQL